MSAVKADSTLMPELDEGTKTNVNSGDEVHKGRGKPLKVKARRGGYYGMGMAEVRGSRQLRGFRHFEGRRIKHQDVTSYLVTFQF